MQAQTIYQPILADLAQVRENVKALAGTAAFPFQERALEHVLDTQGKGIRPAVTLLASRFYPHGGDLPIRMASAVELLHIATLIHDDTVDASEVRRGKPTLNNLWGPRVAVLVGDYLFAASAVAVTDTRNIRVVRRFAETIMDLSTGELMEYLQSGDWTVTREQYLDCIYRKTASLFRTAAEAGALLSGAPEEVVQAFVEYGTSLGLAFQVMDDILDYEGNAQEVGKPVGSDLLHGTLTLPAILLLERVREDNPIVAMFQDGDADGNLKRAVEMIRNSSIIPDVYEMAFEYSRKAIAALSILPDNENRRSLEALAHYAVERRQ